MRIDETKALEALASAAIKQSLELAGSLLKWAKLQYQSSSWKRKLGQVNLQLLLPTADTQAAQELVDLAEEAGFSGPELRAVRERLARVVESCIDSQGRYMPPALTPKIKPMGGILGARISKPKSAKARPKYKRSSPDAPKLVKRKPATASVKKAKPGSTHRGGMGRGKSRR